MQHHYKGKGRNIYFSIAMWWYSNRLKSKIIWETLQVLVAAISAASQSPLTIKDKRKHFPSIVSLPEKYFSTSPARSYIPCIKQRTIKWKDKPGALKWAGMTHSQQHIFDSFPFTKSYLGSTLCWNGIS